MTPFARSLATSLLFTIVAAKSLWSTQPANKDALIQEAYPLGNGRLGVLPAGVPGNDVANINLDSLWTGGPFQNSSYNGGNPAEPVYNALPAIRKDIFTTGQGNISALWTDGGNSYGSYTPLVNLTVSIYNVEHVSDYKRTLDLETATHIVEFVVNGQTFLTTTFCSYPDEVCIYSINSTALLPQMSIGFQNSYLNTSTTSLTYSCTDDAIRFQGLLTDPGMKFDTIARLSSSSGDIRGSCQNNALVVPGNSTQSITILLNADTNYDQTAGDAAHNYSFLGADPGAYVETTTSAAATKSFDDLLSDHQQDYQALFNTFALDLPDLSGSANIETSELISSYSHETADPFLESLLFDCGRYLLIASSRPGSLPANLNGRWAVDEYPAWSADYHININLQMNYWLASQTGLGYDVQAPLFDFMSNAWQGYGERTAELLYNVTNGGFVTHSETDIFGYTGMKNGGAGGEVWADYQAGPMWLSQQLTSYHAHYANITFYQTQGYPLLKRLALFWLECLQPDTYTKDGTLVAAPCTSPEHGPVTFGCAHYQQLVAELFASILTTWSESGDDEEIFRATLQDAYDRLDPGIAITSNGELAEWKLPSLNMPNDTHRHLSHLVGWYPGTSISSTHLSNAIIASAITNTLLARGNGTGSDADAGWEKLWRSACWARLNNTDQASFELRYAIERNFAPNGLSMYSAHNPPFQADANFGLTAAALAMLVTDVGPIGGDENGVQMVILGPAIPKEWDGGSVKGLRLRGGGVVDFAWDAEGVVRDAVVSGRTTPLEVVNVFGEKVA